MRIAYFIKESTEALYFISAATPENSTVLEVRETPDPLDPPRKFWKKLTTSGFAGLKESFAIRRMDAARRLAQAAVCKREFGGAPVNVNRDILYTSGSWKLNEETHQKIRQFGADVVVVFGTSVLPESALQYAPVTLNVHWGLSPWYRGVRCTEWALLKGDLRNIGYTLHRVSARIDGGDILAQGRVEVKPGDTVIALNARMTFHAALKLRQLLERGIRAGDFRSQNLSEGKLYKGSEWTSELHRKVIQIEKSGAIAEMLKSKLPAELPLSAE